MKLARKGKNLTKRIVSLLLILVFLVGIMIAGVVNVNADSNDRIATYIRLAADGSITDGDTSGMTEDQLRFLGLYLSNFYVPFGTEIGTNNDETTNSTKEDMVDTLQQKLAFSEDLATSLVETIFGYTRSSLTSMSVCYVEHNTTTTDISDSTIISATDSLLLLADDIDYYYYMVIMSGYNPFIRFSDLYTSVDLDNSKINSDGTARSDYTGETITYDSKKYPKVNIDSVANFNFAKIYDELSDSQKKVVVKTWVMSVKSVNSDVELAFTINVGGSVHTVGNANVSFTGDVKNYTAYQKAFFKCMEATNQMEKGYGTSFFDFTKEDGSIEEINSMAKSGSITEEEAGKMTILGAKMMVDCFGDVVRIGANHQTVVMPGCINPFSWVQVDKQGEDYNAVTHYEKVPGYALNIINAICMTQAEVDSSSGVSELVASRIDTTGTPGGAIRYKINFEALNSEYEKITNKGGWFDGTGGLVRSRLIAGNTESKVSGNFTDMYKLVKKSGEIDQAPVVRSLWQKWHDDAEYLPICAPKGNSGSSYGIGIKDNHENKILERVVFIDSLGAYKGKDSYEYSAFNVAKFLNDEGKVGSDLSSINFGKTSFGSLYGDIKSGKLDVPTQASEQALCTLYVTYCWACLYDSSNKAETIGKLGYRFNKESFPDMSNRPISLDGSILEGTNVQLEAIQNWTYYILHPTKGFNYVRIWLTNKINHLLLGWHSDMTGTNGVGATVGITKYRSNMGYVTMPDLSEINWTNKLIQLYNDCIPFLIVILLILMLIAFIVGALNLQHAIIGLLIFAVFTLLPVPMINGAVGYSNRISQNVYGDKFTYWALVQQESYASAIDEAANATGDGNSSYENYLRTLYAENEKVYGNQGNESILVKWQAPKKMASLVLTEADAKTLGGLNDTGVKMLRGMLNNTYSGQSYVDDEDAVYMYRSYLDISNFSRYIYNSIDNKTVKYRSFGSAKKNNWKSLPSDSRLSAINTEMVTYMKDGYTNGENFDQSKTFDNQTYLYVPLTSNIINDVLADYGKIKDYSNSNDMVPINADIFNFGLPQFNQSSSSFSKKWDVETFAATGGITEAERKSDLGKELSKYSEEDFVGLASYGLYSENPYYYFSWKLYSDGLKADSTGSKEGYKKLLLQKGEGGYFYNTENNGNKELKDFMNMKGLFTYIIPYMKQCNDMVREWDDTFGIYVYDGIPTEEGHWKDMTTDEMKAKYWHNLNVTRLYCIYCPWVDVMYDCSYAKSETINVMGERVTIDDPLDPQKYPSSRPMIFSASEMADYGLSEADLTSVEKKILRCNEQFEERMYELLNYYKFSDITLNSAAAINCAFVFNNTFSENGIFTENHNIYPQSFDLSNFSYDAFLRLILSNATSESLLDASESLDNGTATGDTSGDFYERLVNRSSTITVIVMLILDVLSVYLIPAFRIFFLVAIFFAAILIVLTSAFRIEASAKFLRKVGMQFVVPLLSFFAATIGFSLVMSLFVGVGNNAVTQTGIFISLGDPVVTMLVMIALDLILLFIYWKIIKKVLKYIKGDAKAVGGFVTGVGAAAVGMVAGAVAAGAGSAQDAGRGASRRLNNWRNRRLQKKGNKSLEEIAQNGKGVPAQDGTGVESGRANERGSGRSAEYAEEAAHNRDLQKDKGETIDNNNKAEDSEERKAEIDAKAENGNIEGSETSSNDLSNGRKNDKVDSKHSDAVSDKEFSARDKVSERASDGNAVGNKSQEGAHRGGKTPREKVGSGSGYSADDYDRAQARKKGIPSTKKEGSAAVKSNSGLDYGNRKTTFATPKNRQGNSRATDRGNKPVDSKPKREKAPSKPKDHRINGGK